MSFGMSIIILLVSTLAGYVIVKKTVELVVKGNYQKEKLYTRKEAQRRLDLAFRIIPAGTEVYYE